MYLKTQENLCIFSGQCLVAHISFVHMVKFKFLALFPENHHPFSVMSSLLLHLLIMWLIVSSLSSHNLHIVCCVLSILTFLWLVLMALFWRDSVYLLRFPFLRHVIIFSSQTSLMSRIKCLLSTFFLITFFFFFFCCCGGVLVV